MPERKTQRDTTSSDGGTQPNSNLSHPLAQRKFAKGRTHPREQLHGNTIFGIEMISATSCYLLPETRFDDGRMLAAIDPSPCVVPPRYRAHCRAAVAANAR
jgi:hypothetical protein